MGYRVFIGVGHGGSDPGANSYVKEADANLTIALELRKQLEAAGIVVGMSRTKDENDPIGEEIREANAFFAGSTDTCLAVEVHNNAGGGDGWECFVQTNQYAAKSRACAQAIEAEVLALGQKSRGLKTKIFGWTYNVKAPAVLLEGFFVDNKSDAADFDTVTEQQDLGRAYARGVLKYLGVEAKPVEEPKAEAYIVTAGGAVAYADKAAAESAVVSLAAMGFTGELTDKPSAPKEIVNGSKVKVKRGAKYYDGKTPNPVVYDRIHEVYSLSGDRVVIMYIGVIIGAVHKDNLVPV
jgi:hypothetical protein